MAKKRKNKTMWAVIGFILIILGVSGAIPFALTKQIYGISISAIAVITGVVIIAWAIGE